MLKNFLSIGVLAIGCLAAVVNATFQSDCLAAHNTYRAKHGAGPLTLDNDLQDVAQNWADYLAANDLFQHSGNGYGENLYWTYGSTSVSGGVPVTSWYNEIVDYDWNNPGFSAQTGHFTQVVWKGSTALGCAIATDGVSTYVVASYNPPGNIDGQFEYNVLRPTS